MLLSPALQMRQLGHKGIKEIYPKVTRIVDSKGEFEPSVLNYANWQFRGHSHDVSYIVDNLGSFYVFEKYISQKLQAHSMGLIHAWAGLEFILEARMGVIRREGSQSGSVIYGGYGRFSILSIFLSELLLNLNSIIHWSFKYTYFRIQCWR